MDKLVKRACEIIFSNEGNYGSVNADDNGAVSIGKVQWHGERARKLLKLICEMNVFQAQRYLTVKLYQEIIGGKSWENRVVTDVEAIVLKYFLSTNDGREAQDMQAENDVGAYIKHIRGLGFTQDDVIILLADIENQGGSGASERIGKKALEARCITLDVVMKAALEDSVFSKYQERRLRVYNKLTGKNYNAQIKPEKPEKGYATYIVKHGDNLSSICAKYGIYKWQSVAELNGIKPPYIINVGQVIKIYK